MDEYALLREVTKGAFEGTGIGATGEIGTHVREVARFDNGDRSVRLGTMRGSLSSSPARASRWWQWAGYRRRARRGTTRSRRRDPPPRSSSSDRQPAHMRAISTERGPLTHSQAARDGGDITVPGRHAERHLLRSSHSRPGYAGIRRDGARKEGAAGEFSRNSVVP
jgi:hypothetical protein